MSEDLHYEKIPEHLRNEFSMLYELGLESYEIQFILNSKTKQQSSLKWGNQFEGY